MGKYNIAIELTHDEQKVLVGQMNDCRKKLLEEDKPTEDIENIIQLMSFDKKNHNGKVLFVLMEDFGAFKLDCEVDKALIFKAFEFYRNF